jgi:hypothetical protein
MATPESKSQGYEFSTDNSEIYVGKITSPHDPGAIHIKTKRVDTGMEQEIYLYPETFETIAWLYFERLNN